MSLNSQPITSNETLSSLYSLCNITKGFKLKRSYKKFNIIYNLSTDTRELPALRTPQLNQLIEDLQECFILEANILMNSQMSDHDIMELFINYQNYLITRYHAHKSYYDGTKEIEFPISPEDTHIFRKDFIESDFTSQTEEFLFELGPVLSTDKNQITGDIGNTVISPDAPLFQLNDLLYPEYTQATSPEELRDIFKKDTYEFVDGLQFLNETESGLSPSEYFGDKKRNNFAEDSKTFLEAVFKVRPFPNSTERKIIAERCQLKPAQVRNWFANKRSRHRGKEKNISKKF